MQVVDANGNVFGQGLEITGIDGKPKVPVINTDITIGTTVINGGVSGRLLFDNSGVVGETAGINWSPSTSTLSLFDSPFVSQAGNSSANTGFSIIGTASSNYTISSSRQFIFNTGQSMYFNTDTDGGSALDRAWYFAGARTGMTGGRTYGALTVDSSGFPSFTLYNNDNGPRILLASNATSYFNGGNLLIGTTTDAGFKLDVNGTARVQGDTTITKTGSALAVQFTSQTAQNNFFTVLNGTDGLQLTSRGSGTTGNMGLPANSAEILCFNKAALGLILHTTAYLAIGAHTAERMRLISSTGNLLIGTTTDAGFKLDVNGTARVLGDLTIGTLGSNNVISFGGGVNTTIFRDLGDNSLNFRNVFSTTVVHRFRTNSDLPNANTSGNNIFVSLPIGFAPTSGTGTWAQLSMTPTINQTGGANGITRGLYINPTLTAAADFRAIETTAGSVIFNGPTTINNRYLYHQGSSSIQYFMTSNAWSGTNTIFFGDDSSSTMGSISYNHQFDSLNISVNSSSRLFIPSTGNILINTTTDAGYKLDVNGSLRTTGILYSNNNLAVGNYDSIISPSGSVNLSVYSNVQETPGRLVVGGYAAAGPTLNGIISFVNTQLNNYPGQFEQAKIESYYAPNGSTGGDLRFYTRTYSYFNERLRITDVGNILINTTTDAGYKLDVNGTAAIRGITNIIGGTFRIASSGITTNPSYISSHSDGGWNFTYYSHVHGAGVHYFTSNNGSASIFSASAREGVNINVNSLTTGNPFSISGTVNASSAIARGQLINTTLVAAANNDVLAGLDIAPTFTNGAFTGVSNVALRIATTTSIVRIESSLVSSFHGIEFRNATNLDAEIKQLPSSGEFKISNGRSVGWGGFTTFYTDTVERMRIRSNGNILIGTTTDAGYKLDVNGNTRSNRYYTTDGISLSRISFEGFNNVSGIQYSNSGGLDAISFFLATGNYLTAVYNGDTVISPVRNTTDNYGDVVIQAGGSERARFKANGNVGIGTNSPSYKLHTVGSAGFDNGASGDAITILNSGYIQSSLIRFRGFATQFIVQDNSYNIKFVLSTSGSFSYFNTGGNVGINTTTDSGYTLNVNGTGYFNGNLRVNGAITASSPTPNTYVCNIGLAADQSIASGSDAQIDFIDIDDTNNWYDPTTKRFTPTIAGYYHIDFTVWFDAATVSTGQYNIQIRKNASTVLIVQQPNINNGTGQSLTGSKLIYFNGTTDYIDFTAYQSTGVNRNLQTGASSSGTYASIFLLAV